MDEILSEQNYGVSLQTMKFLLIGLQCLKGET